MTIAPTLNEPPFITIAERGETIESIAAAARAARHHGYELCVPAAVWNFVEFALDEYYADQPNVHHTARHTGAIVWVSIVTHDHPLPWKTAPLALVGASVATVESNRPTQPRRRPYSDVAATALIAAIAAAIAASLR